MKIVISSGHGKHIRGASGYIDEVDEARLVVEDVAASLRRLGAEVITFHDNTSHDQSTNLNTIVNYHNKQTRNFDISVHFNAYETTSKAMGSEVLYLTQSELAKQVVDAICTTSGLINRGPKKRTDLKFLNATDEPSILVETCFVDSKADVDIYKRQYGNICDAIAGALAGEQARPPGPTPPEPPINEPAPPAGAGSRPTLGIGDQGSDVIALQKALGVLEADGDFGPTTDVWVRAFQAAAGLTPVDGIVGDQTWAAVEALDERLKSGILPLPSDLAAAIYTLAQTSEIADYSWPDRGIPPPGYVAGMALSFAVAFLAAESGQPWAKVMSGPVGPSDLDALAWYKPELAAAGIAGLGLWDQRMRALFTLMIGLGPRESSGKYCAGRDLSAENVQAETCEAGLFQTSWNIKAGHSSIGPLLPLFWSNPNGYLGEFKDGVFATKNDLSSYGSGDGAKYQFLSRYSPLFHVLVTGTGLRVLRKHWGPINEKAVTIRREAYSLLQSVQELVEDEA